jgi:glutamate racemase
VKGLKPVFIADTCIGGLSVVKSLWDSGRASDAIYLADYAINPLGVKNDSAIEDVIYKWFKLAEEHSESLVIACNTLSIRYHQMVRSKMSFSKLKHIVSMVDCFKAMVRIEADRLAGKKVLVIGTKFTASQSVYPDILDDGLPGIQVKTIGATELERKIARLQFQDGGGDSLLTNDLEQAIGETDFAVLACTCFPMVADELETLFPDVVFLDPGAYCSDLLKENTNAQQPKLHITVTGDIVSTTRAAKFARTYLNNGTVVSQQNNQ